MHILIAPDKFRGSLTAEQVIEAMQEGILDVLPNAQITAIPLADGGEGTAATLARATHGHIHHTYIYDALMRPVEAAFGLSGDGKTAYIEMAAASGLQLLSIAERNPMETTTFGTGELILKALELGVENILLCIGGSATNDAGMGMAAALGYRFLDENKEVLKPVGKNLIHVKSIDNQHITIDFSKINIAVACDVENPLYGKNGAAYIYARQKGATDEQIEALDIGLKSFGQIADNFFQKNARIWNAETSRTVSGLRGGGAAGGLGAGSVWFLNATLKSGIDLVMQETNFESAVKKADLILTGEGKIDIQTLEGKVLKGITRLAQKHNVPVIALCGTLDLTPLQIREMGLAYATSILKRPCSLEEAGENAFEWMKEATSQVVSWQM
jgi:glycerate 2-kinase